MSRAGATGSVLAPGLAGGVVSVVDDFASSFATAAAAGGLIVSAAFGGTGTTEGAVVPVAEGFALSFATAAAAGGLVESVGFVGTGKTKGPGSSSRSACGGVAGLGDLGALVHVGGWFRRDGCRDVNIGLGRRCWGGIERLALFGA